MENPCKDIAYAKKHRDECFANVHPPLICPLNESYDSSIDRCVPIQYPLPEPCPDGTKLDPATNECAGWVKLDPCENPDYVGLHPNECKLFLP